MAEREVSHGRGGGADHLDFHVSASLTQEQQLIKHISDCGLITPEAILNSFKLCADDIQKYLVLKQKLGDNHQNLTEDERTFYERVGTRCEVYELARITWQIRSGFN